MAYDFKNVKVLIVECSPEMATLLGSVLQMLTIPENNIDMALTPEEAMSKFLRHKHDLIITDWLENPDHGIKLTKKIRALGDDNIYVPIIMTAGSGYIKSVAKARDSGVSDYVIKPFSAKALASRISRVIEDDRNFVIAIDYIGPDRRFREDYTRKGEDRRKNEDVFGVE